MNEFGTSGDMFEENGDVKPITDEQKAIEGTKVEGSKKQKNKQKSAERKKKD